MAVPRWSPTEVGALVARGEPVMVDLRADWCPQCGPQEAVVERLGGEYADGVHIGSVDVGAYPDYADQFEVSGLPAFLMFADGAHRFTLSGYQRAAQLREAIRKLLAATGTSESR